jgi:hypothetical protein
MPTSAWACGQPSDMPTSADLRRHGTHAGTRRGRECFATSDVASEERLQSQKTPDPVGGAKWESWIDKSGSRRAGSRVR